MALSETVCFIMQTRFHGGVLLPEIDPWSLSEVRLRVPNTTDTTRGPHSAHTQHLVDLNTKPLASSAVDTLSPDI